MVNSISCNRSSPATGVSEAVRGHVHFCYQCWWGIPFGPIFSFIALFNNLKGGKDATTEVCAILNVPQPVKMAA